MEIWEEEVRGGYPPEWLTALPAHERGALWEQASLPPPIFHFLGVRPEVWGEEEDHVVGIMPASPWLRSPQGRIPLGALAIVADLGFGMALGSRQPPGWGFTTAELSLTRVREPALGGSLTATGSLVHSDPRSALTEVRVHDGDGVLVAAGTSRLAVFAPQGDLPAMPGSWEPVVAPAYDTPDPWERDPVGDVLDADAWAERSGREILEAQVAGELPPPPIARLTGLRVEGVGEGTARVSLPATEWLCTPSRTVQGGVTALVADTALACAIQTTVQRGDSYLPVDIKVNHLRPVLGDGRTLTAEGHVTHRGRSIAVAHATVHNADGKPVAVATGSALMGEGA